MQNNRVTRAKLNMVTMILRQLGATLCGIVIPRVMIGAFGSVVYGATTSIAQFLSYISLLESGVGRVARGALYKHLAAKDDLQISRVYKAIKVFFRNVGVIYLIYTFALSLIYHDIADITSFDRFYTSGLVVAISISTIVSYFSGISNMTLMHADQKQYLTNLIITATNVINVACIVLLVQLGADVLTVKLASSIIFVVRPVLYTVYVKKNYNLSDVEKDAAALNQKWTGMGQHIAYFLHTNTDVVLLTLFADLKMVAVYSVYHLVVVSIWNIASSFAGGMEATFGEMIAKKEKDSLNNAYHLYKCVLTMVATVLFGCAGVLIIPFIRLYTKGITDADYIQPLFGLLLLTAEFLNCLSLPCTTLPISANRLKQSRMGSYGEAFINVSVSVVLIWWNPLLGVAIGTMSATVFKSIYYIIFSGKYILRTNPSKIIGEFFAFFGLYTIISVIGASLLKDIQMANYLEWVLYGIVTFAAVMACVVGLCALMYPKELKRIVGGLLLKIQEAPKRA